MRPYLEARLVEIGLGLLVLGIGPLLVIIAATAIGLWPDPNPNPVGPGIFAFLTFWPGLICLTAGLVRVRRRRRPGTP